MLIYHWLAGHVGKGLAQMAISLIREYIYNTIQLSNQKLTDNHPFDAVARDQNGK